MTGYGLMTERWGWQPTAQVVDGLPTWAWRCAPTGLLTRRQMRAADLAPGGAQPVAQVICRRGRRRAYLYDPADLVPKRVPTPAQLRAVANATQARRWCASGRHYVDYCIPTSLGECLECHYTNQPNQAAPADEIAVTGATPTMDTPNHHPPVPGGEQAGNPPTIQEITDLTARLRALSEHPTGPADPSVRAEVLADKQALLDRIHTHTTPSGRPAGGQAAGSARAAGQDTASAVAAAGHAVRRARTQQPAARHHTADPGDTADAAAYDWDHAWREGLADTQECANRPAGHHDDAWVG